MATVICPQNLSAALLKKYRDFVCHSAHSIFTLHLRPQNFQAFPSELAQPNHVPFFSLEHTEAWARGEAVQWFLGLEDCTDHSLSNGPGATDATLSELKLYREFVSKYAVEAIHQLTPSQLLPTQMATSPYFSIDNYECWVCDTAYRAFRKRSSQPHSFPVIKVESVFENQQRNNSSVSKPSRKGKEVIRVSSPEVIEISDDEEPHNPSALRLTLNGSFQNLKRKGREEDILDLSIYDSDVPSPTVRTHKKPKTNSTMANLPHTTRNTKPIRITRKETVVNVVYIDNVPTEWDVSREATAYLIDFSDARLLLKKGGDMHSLISFIRHEVFVPAIFNFSKLNTMSF